MRKEERRMLKVTIADLNKKHVLIDGNRVSFEIYYKDLKVIYYSQKDFISKVITIPEAEKDFLFTSKLLLGLGVELTREVSIRPDELEGV